MIDKEQKDYWFMTVAECISKIASHNTPRMMKVLVIVSIASVCIALSVLVLSYFKIPLSENSGIYLSTSVATISILISYAFLRIERREIEQITENNTKTLLEQEIDERHIPVLTDRQVYEQLRTILKSDICHIELKPKYLDTKISYGVDVIAYAEDKIFLIEAKSRPIVPSDVDQIRLYLSKFNNTNCSVEGVLLTPHSPSNIVLDYVRQSNTNITIAQINQNKKPKRSATGQS